MAFRKLLNVDTFGTNPQNQILGEHISGIVPGNVYFIKHGIYFADSLRVFKDEAGTEMLLQGADYNFSEIDSIASEMSNKNCYRGIIFLTDVAEAYIDYHSYGDILTADFFNNITQGVDSSAEEVAVLQFKTTKVIRDLAEHISNTSPHEASVSAQSDSLVLRTASGAIKVAAPSDYDEVVNLQHQHTALLELENSLTNTILQNKGEILTNVYNVDDKVKIIKPALTADDFLPEEYEDPNLSDEEREQMLQIAQNSLDSKTEETDAYHNVVRNKNGSVTVPAAVDGGDAINKDMLLSVLNERIATLIDNAPETLDTLKELADALQDNEGAIAAINAALANRYTKDEADSRFVAKTSFVLSGDTLTITI